MTSNQPTSVILRSTTDPSKLDDLDFLRYYLAVTSSKCPIQAGDHRDSVIVNIALGVGDEYPNKKPEKRVAEIGLSYSAYNDTIHYLCTNDNRSSVRKGNVKTLVRKTTAKHAQVPQARCSSDPPTFRYSTIGRLTQVETMHYIIRNLLELTDGGRKQLIILSNSASQLNFWRWNDRRGEHGEIPPIYPYLELTGLTNCRILNVDQLAKRVGSSSRDLCIEGQNDLYDNGRTPHNRGNEAAWNLLLAIIVANYGDYDSTSHAPMGQTMDDLAQYLENEKTRERLDHLEQALRVGGNGQRTQDTFTSY
jgi:hypothetical protein